jgi:hypothetical protein
MISSQENQNNPMENTKKQKITIDQVTQAIESCNNIGFCLACGNEQDGCEPDAHNYKCENCGAKKVFGAEELLFMMV